MGQVCATVPQRKMGLHSRGRANRGTWEYATVVGPELKIEPLRGIVYLLQHLDVLKGSCCRKSQYETSSNCTRIKLQRTKKSELWQGTHGMHLSLLQCLCLVVRSRLS